MTRSIPVPAFANSTRTPSLTPADCLRLLEDDPDAVTDDDILNAIAWLPGLPDHDDPEWSAADIWTALAGPYLELAEAAAERRIEAAVALLLERASYGDPQGVMSELCASMDRIVPNRARRAALCAPVVAFERPGTRYWALRELGVLRDPTTLAAMSSALDSPSVGIRAAACAALAGTFRGENTVASALALEALQAFLDRHRSSSDQQAGTAAVEAIQGVTE